MKRKSIPEYHPLLRRNPMRVICRLFRRSADSCVRCAGSSDFQSAKFCENSGDTSGDTFVPHSVLPAATPCGLRKPCKLLIISILCIHDAVLCKTVQLWKIRTQNPPTLAVVGVRPPLPAPQNTTGLSSNGLSKNREAKIVWDSSAVAVAGSRLSALSFER